METAKAANLERYQDDQIRIHGLFLGQFAVIPVGTVDRRITSNFEIPAGSFSMFQIISQLSSILDETLQSKDSLMNHMPWCIWLLPYYVLGGLVEAFNGIGQVEFCYP
ncbi:hypothetical protein V6N13_114691 [Hibiscus sabdariffa]